MMHFAPVFFFLATAAVALFGFLAVSAFAGTRAAERDSYYKNDMLKKLAETENGGEKVLQLLREEKAANDRDCTRQRLTGALVLIAIGAGTMIFLHAFIPAPGIYLSGTIPLFIGIALLIVALMRQRS